MRHGKKFNHLGRKKGHRDALLLNMANSLILHKRINTTLAKAKALRVYVEPILTRSKDNTTHSRRMVFADLQSKEVINELFDVVSLKIADRPGGYCRIIKTGFRKGDGAEIAMIELVDFNDILKAKTSSSKAGTRRSRRKSGGSDNSPEVVAVAAVTTAAIVPDVIEEVTGNEEE
ncbi:MAG: 50S ribosomal protein L17 [Saprospiraceae bacterium]|jgi:large subunit ribosomal protein L17|nr:50S ribosomal protein L17 [Saprospiraceae bacterium]